MAAQGDIQFQDTVRQQTDTALTGINTIESFVTELANTMASGQVSVQDIEAHMAAVQNTFTMASQHAVHTPGHSQYTKPAVELF